MSFDPLSAVLDIGKIAIERLWPDPAKQAEELRKLEELRQQGDMEKLNAHVQLLLGQIEVNKIEAQSKSLFVAGWRPAVGWVSTIALACAYIPKSIVITALWTYQAVATIKGAPDAAHVVLPPFPDLGIMDVLGLLGSMLGIGAMRSYDKGKGTQTDAL